MTVEQAYEIFMAEKRVNGFTDKTLEFYRCSIGGLLKHISDVAGEGLEIVRIHEFINPYFLSLYDRNLSQTTYHTYWRGIKTFTRFLCNEGYIDKPVKLPDVRCPQSAIKPLSQDEMKRLLRSFDTKRFTGLRNQTLIRFFLDTGLRLEEVTKIDLHEISFEEGFALVKGKGKKERWVPIGQETGKAIWKYIKQRVKVAPNAENALFVTQNGNRLTKRGIQMILRRIRKKVGLKDVRLSPHTLRHSFALAYIENGGDPFSLQKILGYSTQAMTSKYVTMARANLKSQHDRFSPGDRI